MRQTFIFLISYLLLHTAVKAQYPRFIFRNPLGIPMHLIANFGEVRSDHYHMGLDLRTQQRENLPVYAAAEGYVSRVVVTPSGYGKSIYVTHPNGYTTLYAHLNQFFPALQQFVEHKQYHDQSWEQDIRFGSAQFPVTKGQYIALSGATGSVEGPHLHFEVRDTKTGNNINPLFLGFPVKDEIKPLIYSLFLYDRNYSTYAVEPTQISIKGIKGKYTTKDSVIYTGSNKISFGISAEDIANGTGFRFGIYGAEIWMDSVLQFAFKLQEFDRVASKYVNASIDYKKWVTSKHRLQHLSRLPGNQLFVTNGQDGIIELNDTLVHNISVTVLDVHANEAILNFKVQFKPELYEQRSFTQETVKFILGQQNEFETESFKITLPPSALYDTVSFRLSQLSGGVNGLPVYQIHQPSVPLHEPYTIEVTPTAGQKDSSKVIMRLNGNRLQVVKPEYRDGKYIGSFDRFGVLVMMEDTVPPNITTTWNDGTTFYKNGSLSFSVKDGISTVEKVRAELDGNWLMFEQKGSNYIYRFDDYCSLGTHTVKVIAIDLAGNEAVRTYNFELKGKPPVKKKAVKKSSKKKKNGNASKRRR